MKSKVATMGMKADIIGSNPIGPPKNNGPVVKRYDTAIRLTPGRTIRKDACLPLGLIILSTGAVLRHEGRPF